MQHAPVHRAVQAGAQDEVQRPEAVVWGRRSPNARICSVFHTHRRNRPQTRQVWWWSFGVPTLASRHLQSAQDAGERLAPVRSRTEAPPETTREARRRLAKENVCIPGPTRPWYRSKAVMGVLVVAALFVVVHLFLLVRVLAKVHKADNSILLLPVVGLSASALVAALALGVNKLSGG